MRFRNKQTVVSFISTINYTKLNKADVIYIFYSNLIATSISFVLLSVVRIDLAKPAPSLVESSILGINFLIKAIGSSTPIIPVEATAIESILML